MDNKEMTVFAETNFRNKYRKFGIKTDDKRRHMYLIGKTGMGKSTVLENMIIDDIRAGKGVAVVDPHGDLAEKIIEYIPNDRINDVVYFNPADMENPFAFNVVEQVEPHLRHLVASGLIGVFQKLWADSWGPRLEYILRNTILAILDYPGSTLLAVIRMLSDKAFRAKVVENVSDPVVRAFWVNEFAGYADKFASEAVSPIQNKVGQFLSSSLIRNIVGQVKSTIDVREIMDEGKILILNLSKGRIGEDNSQLLGSMLITKIQLAAMSRVDIPEKERRDFILYVDEFQNFTSDSFANILSEARKYRLNLVLAHQYVEQLSETVKPAVFGNVGTMIVFRVGATDAEELVKEFAPIFTEEDIVNLPKYEFYLKLMIDGIASDPFSARGLPPKTDAEKTGNLEKVINVSRERYAEKKEKVEEKINLWHSDVEEVILQNRAAKAKKSSFKQGAKPQNFPPKNIDNSFKAVIVQGGANQVAQSSGDGQPQRQSRNDSDIYKNEAVCARCGETTRISFVPDGIRPIYCKSCLSIAKQDKNQELEQRKRAKEQELEKLEKQKEADKVLGDKSNQTKEPAVKEVSLSDAMGMGAVDFKGRKKEKPPTPSTSNDKSTTITTQGGQSRQASFQGVSPASAKNSDKQSSTESHSMDGGEGEDLEEDKLVVFK